MGVRDHQAHAAQPATDELAQELEPELMVLGRTDVDAHHLTLASGANTDRQALKHRDLDGFRTSDNRFHRLLARTGEERPAHGPLRHTGAALSDSSAALSWPLGRAGLVDRGTS